MGSEMCIRDSRHAIRDDWCEIEPIYCCFFSRRISELARSLAARSRANSRTCNLPPNPHILTRHRSTAELRVVGIETSRIESITEEPSPEKNDLAMSYLRTRETITGPCDGLATSLNVRVYEYSKKRNCCCTAYTAELMYLPTGSGETLGPYPGPPRIDKPPS